MSSPDLSLLLPAPQSVMPTDGALPCGTVTHTVVRGCDHDPEVRAYLQQEAEEVLGAGMQRAGEGVVLSMRVGGEPVEGRGPQSYRLVVSEGGISIEGSEPRAVYWGLQTLRQLVDIGSNDTVPYLTVEDWPAFGFRSYSDDISRRQVSTVRDFEFIIRNLSRLKYTHYQPYIEDVILVDRHPRMGIGRGRLTRDEVAHIVAMGKRHFVEIMPQLNSSGHCEHLLSLPEYAAWRYEGNLETLNPELPEVRSFLTDVYQQVFEQFPCRYVHMGLDEARGLGDRPDLYVDHCNFLAQMVLDAGRVPVMWHDMFVPYHAHFTKYSAEWLDKLNHDIVLDQWVYHIDGDRPAFLNEMVTRGFRVLLSPCLNGTPCGAGTPEQWRNTSGLYERGVDESAVIGTNNTSWNDSGATDRHLHWRGHAVNAELNWHGPQAGEALGRTMRAFNAFFYGLRDDESNELLERIVAFAGSHRQYVGRATATPDALLQTVPEQDVAASTDVYEQTGAFRRELRGLFSRTPRNASHLDHVDFGLDRIGMGAARTSHVAELRKALDNTDLEAVGAIAAAESTLLNEGRRRFGEVWLRRHKPEGLEYADMRYRTAISELENLVWTHRHRRDRFGAGLRTDYRPVPLDSCVTSPPRDLAAMPWGGQVFDNVPWEILNPSLTGGRSLIWLMSDHAPDMPGSVDIPVNTPASAVHILHAIYGGSAAEGEVARYTVSYADGATQAASVRNPSDIADWWMPFGHLFGGGGALRIDPDRCRLAFVTGRDQFQGHCLYHYWLPLERAGQEIRSITLTGTAADASVVVAAVTLQG